MNSSKSGRSGDVTVMILLSINLFLFSYSSIDVAIKSDSKLSPYHLVDNARVALDDLHHLGANVFLNVVRNGNAVLSVTIEADGGIDSLKKTFLIDAGNDEAGFVKGLGTLRAGADADGGEGMTYRGEETAFLGQGAAVADHGERIHLQAVVVMETERLVLDDAGIKLETAGLQTLA